MEIKIGTSGYSFEDWRGVFYPDNIEKGKMFDFYREHFPTVEINSTYYRIPHPAVMANINKKAPESFEFVVKAPEVMTHKRKDIAKAASDFKECLKPMVESKRLKGILAQFPYSFKFSDPNLAYITECQKILEPYPLFVEFRHDSWNNREMVDTFRKEEIGYVSVDEPQLSGLLKPILFNTTDTAYLRLHGRNAEHWWGGGALRYDYSYSDRELQEWRDRIKKLEGKAKKLYIFFNNCHLGQAVKNARRMMEMLNL
ncbi:conserved hypothetical protein [Candidatus Zixiibacteriota bacterium]|nr:conserved hypothetical protein [candidate division Zixibacteria bacterium]